MLDFLLKMWYHYYSTFHFFLSFFFLFRNRPGASEAPGRFRMFSGMEWFLFLRLSLILR